MGLKSKFNKYTFPDFVVVGAARAGTTWLHACCEEHPEIFLPAQKKEIDYFSQHYNKGSDFYINLYSDNKENKISGDFSPVYMDRENVPERLYNWNSKVKIFLILRHPVDRAYSNYCMHLRAGIVSEDIDNVLTKDSGYISYGKYYYNIQRFLAFFPIEQIHILLYDDLCFSPIKFLANFFDSLNVDSTFCPSIANKKYHTRKSRPKNQKLYNLLVKISNNLSNSSVLFRHLIEKVRKKEAVNFFHRYNKGESFPVLSSAKRQELITFYKKDILLLEKFLNRDLASWLE